MTDPLWSALVDPVDGAPLALDRSSGAALVSAAGRRYPVTGGIPRFVVTEELPAEQASTGATFSRKWDEVSRFGHDDATRTMHHEWYLQRYGWPGERELAAFLASCDRVLDAGCGVGRDLVWYRRYAPGLVAGVDISTAVDHARANAGTAAPVLLAQGDLAHLPFAERFFDFIACDQVLHHTVDPRASLHHLVSRLRPGGVIAFYVYRVKGPIREFCDDHLRAIATAMPEAEARRLAEVLTRFGKALTEQRVTISIPEAIPELGISAGDFDLQRWIYWTMFKCFYRADWDWPTNVMTNYDWYRPMTAHRYTPDEIRRWIAEEQLEVLHEDLGDAGLSYRCRRPLQPTRGET